MALELVPNQAHGRGHPAIPRRPPPPTSSFVRKCALQSTSMPALHGRNVPNCRPMSDGRMRKCSAGACPPLGSGSGVAESAVQNHNSRHSIRHSSESWNPEGVGWSKTTRRWTKPTPHPVFIFLMRPSPGHVDSRLGWNPGEAWVAPMTRELSHQPAHLILIPSCTGASSRS